MRRRALSAAMIAATCLALAAFGAPLASAAAPAWTLTMTPEPANFAPGATPEYVVVATNVGAKATSGETRLEVELPKAWEIVASGAINSDPGPAADPVCKEETPLFTCKTSEPFSPGRVLRAQVRVKIPLAEPQALLEAKAAISGGGSAQEITTTTPTPVQAGAVPFDFLPGFNSPLTDEDGNPAALAGSHPYQQTVSFGFPTKNPGDGLTNDGHPRNISVELPRGMVGSPAATKVLCTEVELTLKSCPIASQVGLLGVTSVAGEAGNPDIFTAPLYNMVSPPGSAAELATNVAEVGVFSHILAGVRSEGDYGIEAVTRDAIAFGQQPIFNVQAQLWGSPTDPSHDEIRGDCLKISGSCPVPEAQRSETAFLTLPGACPGAAALFEVLADTWEEPSPPFAPHRTGYENADLAGTPTPVQGCGELPFEPEIKARPSTSVTDSPAGLDFTLHQPQDPNFTKRSPATLRDIKVAFPAGLAVNASQAGGLGACSEAQIGLIGKDAEGPHFSKAPQSCPDAAKLGTVEVTSPALIARNSAHEIEEKEGKPVLEVLRGSLYIATPFENPFATLIAAYLVIEDEKSGIVAKLAGEVRLDPQTGQVSTFFRESPELPLEDVAVHLFGGPRGAFITPPVCGSFQTAAELTPWSAAGAVPRSDPFQTSAAPGGGPCPSAEAQMPNAPRLSAGTLAPAAGKYSPLVFKLSRQDGSQRLGRIEATLPTGLAAKLAGVASCSEQDIAKARAREVPRMGRAEQADPSCPAASEVGVVSAAAGAGPTPYYTSGHAYLAGPYKGAPLSIVAIAPAVAGPFDLGAVVVRSALYLDPESGQVRVLSDPLPQLLQGVPIDLRSISVRAERPEFTLNPTSCAEKSFAGQLFSALGAPAPLAERFQVGGCSSLPYKPSLTAHLFGPTHRGGHPRLRTVFTARPGDANTARISFALPHSEFIDQAHFRTICTRVQFAAERCPAGSVYGHISATSPLIDYAVQGPIYLRSSTHKLPDVVAVLRGPPAQPIEVDLDGRVDSVNGGIRTTFETVPDLPVSRAVVSLQGGRKGLFQNSTDICKGTHRTTLKLDAQNGAVADSRPKLVAQCKHKRGGKKGAKGAKGAKGGGHRRR
jgi:hypothetical protein